MSKIEKKKDKLKYVFPAIILVLLIIAVIVVIVFRGGEGEKVFNNYKLQLTYDENEDKLYGKECVTYVNNSNNKFDSLFFHLYPNAFREGAKQSVISSAERDDCYFNGQSYGNIIIESVRGQQEDKLDFTIGGTDENILEVKLPSPLYPDEKVVLNIDFQVCLPQANHRFGHGQNTINFGNFYPIACVYEDGVGFSQSPYHFNGDPFYSDCANYQVEINYSNKYTCASTGELKNSSTSGGKTTSNFSAKSVRDFCFVLSEKFEKVSAKKDGVTINYYGYKGDDDLSSCLKISADALKTFNEMFGDYPYKTLNVAKSSFVHGGMEYPQIVLISDKINEKSDLNYVIVHEIAHQWWYGVVGNDEYNHAWIDEGLAEYSTLLFFEKNDDYGENYKELIKGAEKSYALFEEVYTKVAGDVDKRMDRPVSEFATEPEYTQCTYTKSVLMYNTLRGLIGKKNFNKALKMLYEDYQFKNVRPEEVIAIFEKFGAKESFFNNWLEGKIIFAKNNKTL